MTAAFKGYDSRGRRFAVRFRLYPLPGQNRRQLREEFHEGVERMLCDARNRGCTHIEQIKGARFRGNGRFTVAV